jgi:hypothetical protein
MKYPVPNQNRIPIPQMRPDPRAQMQVAPPMPQQGVMPQQQPQGGNRLMGFLGNNSEALMAMGAGLLSGQTGPEQFGLGMQGFANARAGAKEKAETKAKANQTRMALEKMGADPELLNLADSGAISWGDAYKYHRDAQKPIDYPNSYQEWMLAQKGGYEGSFADWKKSNSGGTTVNVGDGAPGLGKLSTDYGYKLGPDGKPVIGEDGLPMAAPIPGSPASVESKGVKSKAMSAMSALDQQRSIVTDDINRSTELLRTRPELVSGLVGGLARAIPGTPAYSLAKKLETIKANIGFDKLQSMRENSPTGGALGQVSDFENRQLQTVFGNLEQAQSAEDIIYNLRRVQEILSQSRASRQEAFDRDFGGGGDNSTNDPLGLR